jgi:hypothetical protein
MAKLQLPRDFKEFLKLLNSNNVEYLLIGGYAVNAHGYVRMTHDLDIWVRRSPENAHRVCQALHEFGFGLPDLIPSLFTTPGKIIRMGVPPLRLEILTSVSALEFDTCYAECVTVAIEDDLQIPLISLARLRQNKAATGRSKDLADLDNLPK